MTKRKKIDANDVESVELKKLEKIFAGIPEERIDVCQSLMESAAFMASELKKLQDYIREHGWTETYSNGATQTGKKPSSEAQAYQALIKNYNTTLKTLVGMLPEDKQKGAKEEVDLMADFLRRK